MHTLPTGIEFIYYVLMYLPLILAGLAAGIVILVLAWAVCRAKRRARAVHKRG